MALGNLSIFRGLYNWVLKQAAKPTAKWWLAFVSGIESIFFPIPQDVMMLPMMLADRKNAFVIATFGLAGSVIGAAIGYAIGWGFYEAVGKPIIEALHYQDAAEGVRQSLNNNAWWVIITAGVSPIPFKLIVLMSGWAKVNFFMFFVLALVGRSIRFYAFAAGFYFFGDQLKVFIDKYFAYLTILFFIILIGGFVAIAYIF